jgi:2-succinyl-5-enolpyruvyl-6-hydroxy-3-cyclohexene-1-carboxylate synthase
VAVSPESNPPHQPPQTPAFSGGITAADNLAAALTLLAALGRAGLRHLVLCPGSRSAPLAVAASLLEPLGPRLHTAIDERSAAFFALGLGRAEGVPAAVITTSGSAVAQLLPACVEADHGAIPLLLLSADRPARLKGCGANQSVNQESFLRSCCRWYGEGPATGLADLAAPALVELALQAIGHCLGSLGGAPAGAVHLNLPFEEPLHPDRSGLDAVAPLLDRLTSPGLTNGPPISGLGGPGAPPVQSGLRVDFGCAGSDRAAATLDPDRPGLVVAGPWRGCSRTWSVYRQALVRWQRRSGWPLLADGLSGLRGWPDLDCVAGYDLLLEAPSAALAAPQVLRLGSLPASRRLERWLAGLGGRQVLVSEGDPRPLDPLGVVSSQVPEGLAVWVAAHADLETGRPAAGSRRLRQAWQRAEQGIQAQLDQVLGEAGADSAPWSEPVLARQLSRLLPPELPLMLANSSPVRDWESFADPSGPVRPLFGFRGASGIDGTLSEACGLAEALGACVLLSGDLALLHDSNGWLWHRQMGGRLTVVVIDNGGGGIFEQLPIRAAAEGGVAFERLFAMPQAVDPLALAAVHGVPGRRLTAPADLPAALRWALDQPISLLLVATDRQADAALRRQLRTMASQLPAP